jgi:hypothetical protein
MSPRLASPRLMRAVLTAPPPVPKADHVAVRAPCPCLSAPPPSRNPHGERSPSTPPPCHFFPTTIEPSFLSPSTLTQDCRRPPEPSPRRRTPPLIRFPPPSRRQEALVSYRLHPHVRRVASPPWVLERLLLLHLRHGSTAAGRATTCARSVVTARAQRHIVVVRAGRGRPGKPWAMCAVHTGQASAVDMGHVLLCNWAER